MSRLRRARTLAAGIAAAAVAALALTLVPGAQATNVKSPPKAPPATDVLLYRGATTVALDPGAAGALQSLGVSVAPTGSAYASKAGISFPITLGVVDGADLTGQIRHSGGLVFAKGSTKVYLSRFFIDIDATPSLSGRVGTAFGTGDRADLFDLDLSGLRVVAGKHRIALSGVTLKLTAGAAAALNGAFGTSAFTEGLVIGTATVRARTWAVPAV
jgi:hypothetical protein